MSTRNEQTSHSTPTAPREPRRRRYIHFGPPPPDPTPVAQPIQVVEVQQELPFTQVEPPRPKPGTFPRAA